MRTEDKLDKFGKFLVENLRDKGISKAEGLLNNRWKAPALLHIQAELAKLSEIQKGLIIKTVTNCLDSAP